jgi:thiamine kinase-like enzyme
MQPESLAARLWPGRSPTLEPLGGGITNHNLKVLVGGEAYVLRIGGTDTELLGIDRRAEHAAALMAAAVGAGPEVVTFVEAENALVTRFVGGRAAVADELRSPAAIAQVVTTLKPFHDGPAIPAQFDSFEVVRVYAATARDRRVRVPAVYERASDVAGRIERVRDRRPSRPCHNDLLTANFILDDARLWIVDWEYAGMGDIFFDLGNFSVNNGLGPDEEDELLSAYFGDRREQDAASLIAMRFMSDFREAMWGVVQQGISDLDFDFADYARRHFERLERAAAAPRFRAALHTLEQS